MAAYEVLLLNTAVPQIQAAQSGDTYVVPRDIAFSAALTLSGGTANGVPYLSSPGKVLTTGSALTFDGLTLVNSQGSSGTSIAGNALLGLQSTSNAVISFNVPDANAAGLFFGYGGNPYWAGVEKEGSTGLKLVSGGSTLFTIAGTEVMRLTSTGLKASIAGTNADPVFSYTSDTNTGIFFPAADKLGFVAGGGADQMVLTSTGLGIGTSSPASKLHIQSTVGTAEILINLQTVWSNPSGNKSIRWFDGSGALGAIAVNYTAPQAAMTFGSLYNSGYNTTDLMTLTPTGLGIGTSSPSGSGKVLQINDASIAEMRLTTTASGITSGDGLTFQLNGLNGYIWNYETGFVSFGTSGAEKMRLDSSGNLGLGVTPSAWNSSYKGFQLGSGGAVSGHTSSSLPWLVATSNAFINSSGDWNYINNGFATRYFARGDDGSQSWYTAPSGTANSASVTNTRSYTVVALGSSTLAEWQAFFNDSSNNPLTVTPTLNQVLTGNATGTLLGGGLVTQNISFTQAMTLDASGNLLVGATNAVGRFTLENAATTTEITLRSTGGVGTNNRARIIGGYEAGGSNYGGYLAFNTTTSSNVNTEGARITSGGDLAIGRITSIGSARVSAETTTSTPTYAAYLPTTGTETAFLFVNPNGTVGSITTNGTATAYNTSSDYRLKNTIAPMTGALAKVAALKPVTYKWNADGSDGEGFIAHELAEVVPQAVTGSKDAVNENGSIKPQGIDTSFLVATLTAAIQEQQAMINELKAKVAALQGA